MKELTAGQIKRQDSVDNAIYQLIQKLNPTDKEINWDIEMIGDVRDVIEDWVVEKLKITDEQNFYPWVEGNLWDAFMIRFNIIGVSI